MERVQTNPRYKYFKQTLFHAGDEEQFNRYRDYTNSSTFERVFLSVTNKFRDETIIVSSKYRNMDATTIQHTFDYIFHKFKKGIFIKIQNNQLQTFLPFSKANFKNEWNKNIQIDPKYKNFHDFIKSICNLEKRTFNPKKINKFTENWYANNYLVRYEYPIHEGDTNVCIIKDMFESLCKSRKIPDLEFFVNRRDFPLLTTNGMEPYHDLWDSIEQPLVSHQYDTYAPILSMSATSSYADLLSPTWEDWVRVNPGSSFYKECYKDNFEISWDSKIPTAIFRGSSTGKGVTIPTNPRLKAAYLSLHSPNEEGYPLLDAGITKWNLRPRKISGNPYLQTIDIRQLPFSCVPKLSPQEQARYKYILHIQGHVSAFRLSLELSMGCVILMVESPWKIWYSSFLKPYVHYVPVKKDLSDLYDQIRWCRQHDAKCKEIAREARDFYQTYLQKDGILDWLQSILVTTKETTGIYFYNTLSLEEIQMQDQFEYLQNDLYYPSIDKKVPCKVPKNERCFGFLQGVHWMVNKIQTESEFFKEAHPETILFRNKYGRVQKYSIANFQFALKESSETYKRREYIHEAYIGLQGLNQLCKKVPNFVYTFGYFQNSTHSYLITEYIEGETLLSYIQSSRFKFSEYLLILYQICWALQIAQQTIGLVHYDLTSWNVMLKRLPQARTFPYYYNGKTTWISTNIIPILIDFGKSHIINPHDLQHHGWNQVFQSSKIQDVLMFLLTTMGDILQYQNLSFYERKEILLLGNFLTQTSFRREKFTGISDLKNFTYSRRKYTDLLNSNKYELEKREPYDLIIYICKHFDSFWLKVPPSSCINMPQSNPRQVFDYIYSSTQVERLSSYVSFFENVKKLSFPQNKLLAVYTGQRILHEVRGVGHSFLFYTNHKKCFQRYYYKIENLILNKYKNHMREMKFSRPSKQTIYFLKGPIKNEIVHQPIQVGKYLDKIEVSSGFSIKYYDIIDYLRSHALKDFLFSKEEQKELQEDYKRVLSREEEMRLRANYSSILKNLRRIYGKNLEDPNLPDETLGRYKNILDRINLFK